MVTDNEPSSRRRFLQVVGATGGSAALAGCTGVGRAVRNRTGPHRYWRDAPIDGQPPGPWPTVAATATRRNARPAETGPRPEMTGRYVGPPGRSHTDSTHRRRWDGLRGRRSATGRRLRGRDCDRHRGPGAMANGGEAPRGRRCHLDHRRDGPAPGRSGDRRRRPPDGRAVLSLPQRWQSDRRRVDGVHRR